MNKNLILFSGLMSAVVGAMIGLAASHVAAPRFESSIYKNLGPRYALAGGVMGLLAGAGMESLRQLKQKVDQEEERAASAADPDETEIGQKSGSRLSKID